MPAIIIRINPECSKFLNKNQHKNKNISEQQKNFIESAKTLHETVNKLKRLKEQTNSDFQFDEKQKEEISRGCFFALTKSLQNKYLQIEKRVQESVPRTSISLENTGSDAIAQINEHSQKENRITLSDLQSILNKEFKIKDKKAADFIIKSLLEPHSLPFALSVLSYSVVLPLFSFKDDEYYWTNTPTQCTIDSKFKYVLKAKTDPTALSEKNILFELQCILKSTNPLGHFLTGSTTIQFSVNQHQQIKLLPLTMQFTCMDVDTHELTQFKKKLYQNFKGWVFQPKTHWQTHDLLAITSFLGYLVGLIAMLSFITLKLLIPTLLLSLFPPLGLGLGLCVAGFLIIAVHFNIKKEQQRPIHLFHNKLIPTSNHPPSLNSNETMNGFFNKTHTETIDTAKREGLLSKKLFY